MTPDQFESESLKSTIYPVLETVGDMMLVLSQYPPDMKFGFLNQPVQRLEYRVSKLDGFECLVFQEPMNEEDKQRLLRLTGGGKVIVIMKGSAVGRTQCGPIVSMEDSESIEAKFNDVGCKRLNYKEEINMMITGLPHLIWPTFDKPFHEVGSQKERRRKGDKRNFNHYNI